MRTSSGVSRVQFPQGPWGSSGGRKRLCLSRCGRTRRLHLVSALQEAAHVSRTVANCRLIQAKTLLKGFEGFSTGLADLADDGVGGCAASNAHLKVVTVPMPGLWLGGHTLAILIQLPAAVSSCDFQGCLHLQASSSRSERRDPPFPVTG